MLISCTELAEVLSFTIGLLLSRGLYHSSKPHGSLSVMVLSFT